jgi:hypothetical protein
MALKRFVPQWLVDMFCDAPPDPVTGGVVGIDYFGTRTMNPKVCVSIGSRRGLMTITAEPLTDQNDARATLTAGSLSNILGIPLVDRRKERK